MATSAVVPGQYDPNNPYGAFLPNQMPTNGIYGYSGNPYGGYSAAANNGAGNGTDTSQLNYAPSGNEVDLNPTDPYSNQQLANRDTINTTGNVIGQEGGNELDYYGAQQVTDTNAENSALNQLAATPGYTTPQQSQINVDYSQFNTPAAEQQAELGDPNAPVQAVTSGVQGESAAANAYGQDLSGQVSNLSNYLGSAQQKFSGLDTAVGNPALNFDPNQTEQQLTPQQQQAIVTNAGTTVGSQFQTAEDQLRQQAAAQGNTSPEALAAMNKQLTTQEAATAGNAMTAAGISAEQAAFNQAQAIEAQRESQTNTQAGLQATAATTEEAAAQAAATTAGTADINAANTYGQFNVGQQNTQTGQEYGAQNTAEQEGVTAAQQVANQQYAQGTGSQQLTSQGAQTVGNANIAGEGAYRSGVSAEQASAQQGAATGQQTQLGAYGTQTSGENTSLGNTGSYDVGQNALSLGSQVAKNIGSIPLFEKGGIATEPTTARIAEHGPEMVMPLNAVQKMQDIGRYRSRKPHQMVEDEDGMFRVAA